MPNNDNREKEVDERFNKKFCGKWDEIEDIQVDLGGDNHPDELINIAEPIKDFIHQELAQARKEERQRLTRGIDILIHNRPIFETGSHLYDKALRDVLKSIESL